MNFLFFTHIYPPATDGGSKIIFNLQKQFKKHKQKTMVLTTDCHSTDDFVKKYNPLPSSTAIYRLPVYTLHHRLPKPIFKIIPFLKAITKIYKFKPDFIITGPLPTLIALYATIFSKLFRTKLIILPCFHQFDADFFQKHLVFCLKQADLILTLTNHEKKLLHSKFKLSKSKLLTIYGGIDKNLLSKQPHFPKEQNILFLGNFSSHKRTELLIAAFQKLISHHPNLSLTLAGQQTLYSPNIESLLEKIPARTRKQIFYYPKKYNCSDLKKFLDNCTLTVLPSVHESFGLVFIESLARHKPIIGTDIPPVKEIFQLTQGGLVFKKDNINDLAEKINTLLINKKLSQELADNGCRYVKNHLTWDKIGNRLCQKLLC